MEKSERDHWRFPPVDARCKAEPHGGANRIRFMGLLWCQYQTTIRRNRN